ncbi:hypothetical protein JCM10449v2_000944 [Rhodotorula kratochvilovae]
MLQLEGASSSSSKPSTSAHFTFTPVRGPFHTLKLLLTFSPSFATRQSASLCFRLSVTSPATTLPASETSPATTAVRAAIGEPTQVSTETWDDKSYVFLSVTSGAMEVKLEGREAKVSSEKVQTALRRIRLPAPPSSTSSASPATDSSSPSTAFSIVTIVERPGLNNSTGQRLWDCAIGLCAFLALHPSALDASKALPTSSAPSSAEPPAKKARASPFARETRIRVVELGAGCALASLAAAHVLRSSVGASVLATDVQATVETTLRENLAANAGAVGVKGAGAVAVEVEAEVLDWGELAPEQVERVVDGAGSVTLLGTDILYNPESYALLLATLLSVLRPAAAPSFTTSTVAGPSSSSSSHRRTLIAYKRRTEGDDGFFDLARTSGLDVAKVWEWGEVSIWSFT